MINEYSKWHHPYKPAKKYDKKVAYFSMEFGIHQALKIYSGGLGFLAGSHMRSAFELMGCEVELSGSYPGWTPNANSEILDLLSSIYEKQNGSKAAVVACHAGLECGILGTNYPDMDMISFGPTIKGAHSPDERASIASSQKFWKLEWTPQQEPAILHSRRLQL